MTILRTGDRGAAVADLQRKLIAANIPVIGGADGIFGPNTEAAVRSFQRRNDLLADGIAGPKTFAALGGSDTRRLLHHSDIERAARDLDVPVAAVMAVNEVESRGSGLHPDGQPVILFERHIMRRELLKRGVDVQPWEQRNPELVNLQRGGYQGGIRENGRLQRAKGINYDAAVCSASWGLFQIMGFHSETLGYASPGDWELAMGACEGNQLDAFVRFIRADRRLHQALRARDWETFARIYNGPAYATHDYHGRMAAAFTRHQAALETLA